MEIRKKPAAPAGALRKIVKTASALHPWGKLAHAVLTAGQKRSSESAARSKARALARKLYPQGKALPRLRYFETQRGLAQLSIEPAGPKDALRRSTSEKAAPRYAPPFKAKVKMRPAFAAAAQLPVWRELGPTLIPNGGTYGTGPGSVVAVSGRCVGLCIDPTDTRRLTVCTAGGGLWRSDDAGQTWRPLTDQQPTLAMGAIAYAANSPNIVYAGTGEGDSLVTLGVGLLRSSDGGQTWTHQPTAPLVGNAIYDIAVDPANHLHVWIGAVDGLYESRDGGATANKVFDARTWDLAVHPARPQEIFAACSAGLARSTDGGANWALVSLPNLPGGNFARMEVCFAPSNPGIVYVAASRAGRALLWRRASANGAFQLQSAPANMKLSQAWYDWCFAVAPDNPDQVIWGGIDLYRGTRTSAGFRWSNISTRSNGDSIHPDQHHLAFDPVDPNVLYVCNDGGLFRSPDRGTRWQSLNPGLGITEFEFIAHMDSDSDWLIGGTQDNGTVSLRGQRRWDQVAVGDGGDCDVTDGAQPVCFHSFYNMWIERAPAKGPQAFAWTDISPDFPDGYACLFYPPLDVLGTTIAKAGETVFISANLGSTWQEVALPAPAGTQAGVVSALTLLDNGVLLAGTETGVLYRITRGAGGWAAGQVAMLASPRAAFISDIVPVDAAGAKLWLAYSGVNGAHVFRSTDGGTTWQNRSGNLPDIAINALVVDPLHPNRVYAASDNGVYRTVNSGGRWIDFSNGLPNAVVGDLILHEGKRLLRAGTRNRGVWEVAL